MQMSKHELRALTLKGAQVRLAELDDERPRLQHLIQSMTAKTPKQSATKADRTAQVAGIRKYWKKKRAAKKAAEKARRAAEKKTK